MDYSMISPSYESAPSLPFQLSATSEQSRPRRRFLVLILISGLLLASVVALHAAQPGPEVLRRSLTSAISLACRQARYPTHCTTALENFPDAANAGERDLVHMSLNMTMRRVSAARYGASAMATASMDMRVRAAYEDCIELLDDSVDQLRQSLVAVSGGGASREDVQTWLSAALSNHDTCSDGFDSVADGYVKRQMADHLKDLSELVSNCLAILTANRGQDFAGVPIEHRRLLSVGDIFPNWLNSNDRKLLQMPSPSIQADFIVSKDGNGTHKTIGDAVKAAPEGNSRRFIIYIKAGRYEENIKVGRKKINIMFVGEGKARTIVAGSRSIYDNYTTFQTATFAATGTGFIMKDMTIENWAGPAKHQAVALRVGADHAVVYRCNIIGYQDTLYVHSQRQFFRECDIYGTVDFIFGNAAVVFQKCRIWARKPLPMQKITITAQNRKDSNQNTGISIHDCRILPARDLNGGATNSSFQTFLGRPWKLYSRVVYMLSYMGGHIEPRGWLEWNETFAVDTLYYGEYMNSGPGAAVGKRVQWPGYRVITSPEEAAKFTVANFIFGSSWIPPTGVAFRAGLNI